MTRAALMALIRDYGDAKLRAGLHEPGAFAEAAEAYDAIVDAVWELELVPVLTTCREAGAAQAAAALALTDADREEMGR